MSTIRKLDSGNFQAIVRINGFTPKHKTFQYKTDATQWADAIELELNRTSPLILHDWQTLKWTDLVDRYVIDVNQYHRGYARGDKYRASQLKKAFKHSLLSGLTPDVVDEYKLNRLEQVSSGTVKRELGYMQRVFSYVRKDLHLQVPDIFQQIRMPRDSEPRDRVPSEAEYNHILDELRLLRSPIMADLVVLAKETAMRRGELLSIKAEHLNLRTKTLLIPITKTDKPRTIPLTPEALKVLCKYASINEHTSTSGLVSGRKLFPIQPNSVTTAFRRITAKLKLSGIVFHSLRHMRITELFEMGWTEQEVCLLYTSDAADERIV